MNRFDHLHNPKEFWAACLKHCEGSYRRWVYQSEAHRHGLPTMNGWWKNSFIPALGVRQQWLDRVEFSGLIANGRVYKGNKGRYVTFVTLGTDYGEYIDVVIHKPFAYRDGDVIHGTGRIRHKDNSDYIDCYDAKLYTINQWR